MSAEMQKEDLNQESVSWVILPQWADLWGWQKTKHTQTSTSKTYRPQDTSSEYANRVCLGGGEQKKGQRCGQKVLWTLQVISTIYIRES